MISLLGFPGNKSFQMSASSEDRVAFLEADLKKEKSRRTLTISATLNSRDFGGEGAI